MKARALIAASALVTLGACQVDSDPGKVDGATLSISIAPLSLTGVIDACYNLFVSNGGGAPVWSKTGICADAYGDDGGSISYVGTCDASAVVKTNTVTLELTSLSDANGPIPASEYVNPCPAGLDRCQVPAVCTENADTPVVFNLVVARDANQGFFDIAVNFEDVFCSAKMDCIDSLDQPIHLLFYPPGHAKAGTRGPTTVLAFACTSGKLASGGAAPTNLYLDHVVVDCGSTGSFAVDPTAGPGNTGGHGSVLFETAVYRGREDLSGIVKGYWNVALGFDTAYMLANSVSCTVRTRATAHEGPFAVPGHTPANTIYPFIGWHDVPVGALANGELGCGKHPLDELGSLVTTEYTGAAGIGLLNEFALGTGEVTTPGAIACGALGAQGAASVTNTGAGLVFKVGDLESAPVILPQGMFLAGSSSACCVGAVCQ